MSVIKVEYVWVDGFGKPRSKTKVLHQEHRPVLEDLPIWNYDGSSTGQAPGSDSEVFIRPQVIYPDPFRGNPHILVLCDTYLPNGKPHPSNTRYSAARMFKKNSELEPMFGIEQEFFITRCGRPFGFPRDILYYPEPQGNYYCGTGADYANGRKFIEDAFEKCLKAGLKLTGLNAEVAPGQWEFQVCANGIDAADQLIMLRYIVDRTLEIYGWNMNIHPKPVSGDWNGSGCHTNFSTKPMREKGGYSVIIDAVEKLSKKHKEHMENYGAYNRLRMTGQHETASFDKFSYGVANRGCSIRIPTSTEKKQCGYFEDRRPASNMDPYVVTSLIFETTSL